MIEDFSEFVCLPIRRLLLAIRISGWSRHDEQPRATELRENQPLIV